MKNSIILVFLCVCLLKLIIITGIHINGTSYYVYDYGPSTEEERITYIICPNQTLENINFEKGTAIVKVNLFWFRNKKWYCIKINLDRIDFNVKNFDAGEYISFNRVTQLLENCYGAKETFLQLERLEYTSITGDSREYALYSIERSQNSSLGVHLQVWLTYTFYPTCEGLIQKLNLQTAISMNQKCSQIISKPDILNSEDINMIKMIIGCSILSAVIIIIGVYQVRVLIRKIKNRNRVVPLN